MALNAIHVSHRHAGKWTNQSLNSLFVHTLPVYNSFKLFTSSSCAALFTLRLDCTCPLMRVRSLEGLLLFPSAVNVFPIKTPSHCSFGDSPCDLKFGSFWKVSSLLELSHHVKGAPVVCVLLKIIMSQTETCKLHLAFAAEPRCPRCYCLREDGATENQSHPARFPSKIIQTLWIQNLAPELGQQCLEMSGERLILVFVFFYPIVRIKNKASFFC